MRGVACDDIGDSADGDGVVTGYAVAQPGLGREIAEEGDGG